MRFRGVAMAVWLGVLLLVGGVQADAAADSLKPDAAVSTVVRTAGTAREAAPARTPPSAAGASGPAAPLPAPRPATASTAVPLPDLAAERARHTALRC